MSPNRPLIVLDLANNHSGSLEHATKILASIASIASSQVFRIAIKFQYRDLDSFIHPSYRDTEDFPYVRRFLDTRLSWSQFEELTHRAKELGFLTAATPFDEASVSKVIEHNHDFLKIASASITDWPLWEAVSETNIPVVASTAGAAISDVDRVASFLSHHVNEFALMHCVAAYPTRNNDLILNRIDLFRMRYPQVPIGFSTHEDPDNDLAGPLALAKGCVILERHIGQPAEGIELNAYSSTPEQVSSWLARISEATEMFGTGEQLDGTNAAETLALGGLRRGVFLNRDIPQGHTLQNEDVFFAIPLVEGQISANDWSKHLKIQTTGDSASGEPVMWRDIVASDESTTVRDIVRRVTDFLDVSQVTYPANAELEISHHYGLDHFSDVGVSMITVVNREYCKKLLVLLAGQEHPEQWHDVKEETFHVLHGELSLWLDESHMELAPGDVVVVERGVRHRFSTRTGCIIEEISTRHEGIDSFYVDPAIGNNQNRKTYIRYWRNKATSTVVF